MTTPQTRAGDHDYGFGAHGTGEDAMDLSAEEVDALAQHLVARRLDDDWLMWEDVPALSERAFMRLEEAVDELARDAWATSKNLDGLRNIDSAHLMEQATDA